MSIGFLWCQSSQRRFLVLLDCKETHCGISGETSHARTSLSHQEPWDGIAKPPKGSLEGKGKEGQPNLWLHRSSGRQLFLESSVVPAPSRQNNFFFCAKFSNFLPFYRSFCSCEDWCYLMTMQLTWTINTVWKYLQLLKYLIWLYPFLITSGFFKVSFIL